MKYKENAFLWGFARGAFAAVAIVGTNLALTKIGVPDVVRDISVITAGLLSATYNDLGNLISKKDTKHFIDHMFDVKDKSANVAKTLSGAVTSTALIILPYLMLKP